MSISIIAGPCSAESPEQLRRVVSELHSMPHLSMIRAGVWKPRTRPGAFEGLGEPALAWMRQLSSEFDIPFCCEVARPEHVELCLQYGIQAVWIGARTTTNPFMVEEICSALRGTDLPVMVKNPVCPDVSLWLGAFERLQKVGISNLTAIHRGFSTYHSQGFRNPPLWEVAMEFRRERPDIPILCDPSHICGRRDMVAQLSLIAYRLSYNGLMVEVHPSPSDAWTDASQQITPHELRDILDLWSSNHSSSSTNANIHSAELAQLRADIDTVDHSVLRLLAHRMELSRRIASIKQEHQLPVYQSARWADVIDDRLRLSDSLGLSPSFVKDLLEHIHAESVRIQMLD